MTGLRLLTALVALLAMFLIWAAIVAPIPRRAPARASGLAARLPAIDARERALLRRAAAAGAGVVSVPAPAPLVVTRVS